jgi:hypothetical protein
MAKNPFSLVMRRNILTVHRETFTQYITVKREGEESLHSCTL